MCTHNKHHHGVAGIVETIRASLEALETVHKQLGEELSRVNIERERIDALIAAGDSSAETMLKLQRLVQYRASLRKEIAISQSAVGNKAFNPAKNNINTVVKHAQAIVTKHNAGEEQKIPSLPELFVMNPEWLPQFVAIPQPVALALGLRIS
jgi:flagellar biosynthesis/type III secretory pathway chaperone